MKTNTFPIIGCLIMGTLLFGCDSDDAYERGGVQCNATYIIDDSGNLCNFGECGAYDNDLRDHFCPSATPLCIKDESGRHYCGTHCPEGYTQTDSSCEKGNGQCGGGQIYCNGTCVNPNTDPTFCGSDALCIPNPCSSEQTCIDGKCACPNNQLLCNDQCIDVQNDIEHCGDCETNCTEMEGWAEGVCDGGRCTPSTCIEGYHTSPQTDGSIMCEAEPCGDSGLPCPPNSYCIPEMSQCVCNTGYTNCLNGCFDLNSSIIHCGMCDNACEVANADNMCVDGLCSFTCHDGYKVSADGTYCEPQQTEDCTENEKRCHDNYFEICKDNTWVVAEDCTPSQNQKSQCDPASGCIKYCMSGFAFCPPNDCVDITSSLTHCGECDNACNVANATNICNLAQCEFSCNPGFALNKDGTGCEVTACTEGSVQCVGKDIQTCKNSQWVTTKTCTTDVVNAEPICQNAQCSRACKSGFSECGGKCVNYQSDVNNCGGCGSKCNVPNAENKCNSGKCSFTCKSGYTINSAGTGCEVKACDANTKRCSGLELQTCKNNNWFKTQTCTTSVANSTAVCDKTTGCGYSCNSGFSKCSNACVNLQIDSKNCGACGNACSSVSGGSSSCTNGTCTTTCNNNNLLLCGNSCVASNTRGLVNSNAKLYTSPGSGEGGNATKYTLYNLYGQSGNYYAVLANKNKRYIEKGNVYIFPATGAPHEVTGVNIRQGPSTTAFSVIGVLQYGEEATIDNYEQGTPVQGVGWYHITSPVVGYVSAYYIEITKSASGGSLPNCP
ncbi:MAG: SH3 domain-containing protein [Proteobacteria bacterium]|nr:SH3 domain-containing protein [Pseudomonadota bacterium]